MVKSRMTALDVRATVEEMRASLVGLRLQKIYNINSKMFLFRFGEGENKKSVLLESGVRFHLTELAREKPTLPSQFVMKLRKHIRSWRLDSIVQLQHDRTVDLCFGIAGTEGCFHIIVELFSKGNVILTDYTYKMMMLLRTHRDDDGLNLMVNQVYPITAAFAAAAAAAAAAGEPAVSSAASAAPSIASAATTATTTTAAATARGSVSSSKAVPSTKSGKEVTDHGGDDDDDTRIVLYPHEVDKDGVLHRRRAATEDADLTPAQQLVKARRTQALKADWDVGISRSDDRTNVQSLVAGVRHFGPDLAQHVLTITGVANKQKKSWTESADDLFAQVLPGLLEAYDLARIDLASAGGFLIKQKPKAGRAAPSSSDAATVAAAGEEGGDGAAALVAVAVPYESFTPILLAQYAASQEQGDVVYRPSFGRVCDEFFLITETERIDTSNEKRAKTAKGKEEKFAKDHARRIHTLESDIALNHHKGEQLILNADRVDEALQLINGALATGISWDSLRTLLKRRHAEGHPVAYMIHELFLERNSISVLLEQALDEEEGEEDCDVPPLVVEVALAKTAHANAADYFGKQKQHRSKLERTVAATDKAAAGAARKGARKAAEQKEKKVIVKERQRGWWEKFYWFRTSSGDLVLRGRDVQSTELLVRRVMRLGDLFLHCEVDGSLPCLLRPLHDMWHGAAGGSKSDVAAVFAATQPVALHSLQEAGAWCVAMSGVWESKQSTGSWWVYASQVTGGTATGTYLYSGERHHLPPQPMALGCALLFYVSRSVHEPPPAAAVASAAVPAAGEEEEQEEEEAGTRGDAEMDTVPSSPLTVLRCELPSLLMPPSPSAPPASSAEAAIVPPDPATALAELPSVEALRAEQRKQNQFYSTAGAAVAPSKKGKTAKKAGGARNSRVDREGLRGGPAGAFVVLPDSSAAAALEDSMITASTTTAAVTATASTAGGEAGKRLTKHQKRKLRKIQCKYGDQDDEDRMLGAQVNGNRLSRVQLLELQRQAEEAAQRAQEQATQAAQPAPGTRQHRSAAADEMDGEDDVGSNLGDAEEGVEEVSDFTDDDNDDDDADSNGRAHGADVVDADADEGEVPESESGINEHAEAEPVEGGDGEDEAAGTTTTTAAATGSRNDRDAAVAQQAAELARGFAHYTMRPSPADIVQHVVAVCAPMMVVTEYAYHAALCMGNAKKGALAAKLLQVFTAQAQGGEAASRSGTARTAAGAAGAQGGGNKKNKKASMGQGKKSGSAADAAATPPIVNASLVKALQMTSANDVVEQLRANVKPVDFRV